MIVSQTDNVIKKEEISNKNIWFGILSMFLSFAILYIKDYDLNKTGYSSDLKGCPLSYLKVGKKRHLSCVSSKQDKFIPFNTTRVSI